MRAVCIITLGIFIAATLKADEVFPKASWKDAPDPLASPDAYAGGALSTFAGQYPQSFNYYLANNSFCSQVFSLMYETLLDMDPLTLEYTPAIASKWTISDDKQSFTFSIDPRATWSDGHPITAEDVRWTYDAIMDPANTTGPHKVSLGRFSAPKVLNKHTIQFTANEVHWQNVGAVGGFHILPKHAFSDLDFNNINFEFPVVSGPYQIAEVKEGIALHLARREQWWQRQEKRNQNKGNFEILVFRFYSERENAFEAFKKGLIDIYPVHTSRLWVKETRSDKFVKNWIVKQKIENYQPVGFQGFAMNMRRPPFDDIRVRKAMAHLLDRERMNRTLMYSQYFLHRSYYEDLYSPAEPCTNPSFTFSPERAETLLKEAGWAANPETGVLEKDGKPFAFTFLSRDPSSDKFLQIYNEALQNAGIQLSIERKDWAAWAKSMDTFDFEMTWAAWGAGLFKNPESMWHSAEANRPSGNNITGFEHEIVDALIEKQKTEFDVSRRHADCRKIDAIIAQSCPYALLWNLNYTRLLYWNKFGVPPTVLSKYGDASASLWYWWYDEDSAADLEDSMQTDSPLPPISPVVDFDQEFTPENASTHTSSIENLAP
ncbi:MAG: ABC transporter substrate-binding protein [Verrucomicrobia bacterium]|jgi:microcin C transport system substrate-binding protein|nr:ABC transporter substrate-binding protein [Verrucomicrobiota bacterium]